MCLIETPTHARMGRKLRDLKRPLSLPTNDAVRHDLWRWMIPSMTLASALYSAARAAVCQAVSFPSGLTFAVRIANSAPARPEKTARSLFRILRGQLLAIQV